MNQLEQIRQFSTVVADTGNFQELAQFSPQDATTNPSLVLKAVQNPTYRPILERVARDYASEHSDRISDRLVVAFGQEILKVVPGRVSTEVDARLSFDTLGTVHRAQEILELYKQAGVDRDRVLIKIAATWEGIQAAKHLEAAGFHCNLTLLFGLPQAIACAEAGVRLISPFVGRIYDWHKARAGANWNEVAHAGVCDPGVQSVTQIYHYFKEHGIPTEVMGASFRNTGQIVALAGCDLMTISPALLKELAACESPVEPALKPAATQQMSMKPIELREPAFRLALNNDAMATEKLAEGIRQFVADAETLEQLIDEKKLARNTIGAAIADDIRSSQQNAPK